MRGETMRMTLVVTIVCTALFVGCFKIPNSKGRDVPSGGVKIFDAGTAVQVLNPLILETSITYSGPLEGGSYRRCVSNAFIYENTDSFPIERSNGAWTYPAIAGSQTDTFGFVIIAPFYRPKFYCPVAKKEGSHEYRWPVVRVSPAESRKHLQEVRSAVGSRQLDASIINRWDSEVRAALVGTAYDWNDPRYPIYIDLDDDDKKLVEAYLQEALNGIEMAAN